MKFSIFDKFGAGNSAPVFQAFRQGLERLGMQHSSHDDSADVAVIWSVVWAGRMAGNQQIWQRFRDSGRSVIVLEVGALQRGKTWKIAVNGTGSYAYHGQGLDLGRPAKLGLRARAWRHTGSKIVICTQRTDSLQWQGQPDIAVWLDNVREILRMHTDRRLVVRPHPRQRIPHIKGLEYSPAVAIKGSYDDFDFEKITQDTWAVINHNSGPGIQSVLLGVPAFVDASSLAAPVANLDLGSIESPQMPDRGSWLLQLSHTEWTVEEIATGWPLQRLLPGLQPR